MANTDFYENLDLTYPEIGICAEKIDRCRPGKKKFFIPILTPYIDTSTPKTSTVVQRNSNIMNYDKSSVEVSNLTELNYIEIEIPKELCAYVGGDFEVKGKLESKYETYTIQGNGTVGPPESYSVLSATGTTLNGTTKVEGKMLIKPVERDRYIEKNSKWLIVFIGGDINKPRVICRLPDDGFTIPGDYSEFGEI
jgi:hypothetical protein